MKDGKRFNKGDINPLSIASTRKKRGEREREKERESERERERERHTPRPWNRT